MDDRVDNYELERQFKPIESKPVIVYVFLTANIVMWLFTMYYSFRYNIPSTYVNIIFGAKVNALITEGEYWRLVTPIFLHGGIVHLLVNSYSLYAVGPTIERMFGGIKFIVIYLFAGIIGNVASFLFTPHPQIPSVGASGAIFGLVGALGYVAQKNRNTFGRSLGMNILIIIIYNLAYGFSRSGIDNSAHIGGLIGGYLLALIVGLRKKNYSSYS